MQPCDERDTSKTDGDGEKQSAKEMVTPMPMPQLVPQHGTQTGQGSHLNEPTGDEDERATKSDQPCWRFRHGFPQGQPIRDARQFARPLQFCRWRKHYQRTPLSFHQQPTTSRNAQPTPNHPEHRPNLPPRRRRSVTTPVANGVGAKGKNGRGTRDGRGSWEVAALDREGGTGRHDCPDDQRAQQCHRCRIRPRCPVPSPQS